MRYCLLLEFEKGHIEYLLFTAKAMPLDYQQPQSIGHYEKKRSKPIPIRSSLFQCLIQMRFIWLFGFYDDKRGIWSLLLLLGA
jgi:hypothetical protein